MLWTELVDQLCAVAGPAVGGFVANGAQRRHSGPLCPSGEPVDSPVSYPPMRCAAMRPVDRSHFVPSKMSLYAHLDMSIKLGRWKKAGAVEERVLAPPSVHALCLSLLREHLMPGSAVLDAACGTGYFGTVMARAVAGHGGRVTAADTSRAMVDSARECATRSAPDLLESATLDLIAVENWAMLAAFGPYDAIHLGTVLVKTGVPTVLVEMLKPGGRLVAHVGGEVERMVVIDKQPDETATTRVLNKVWPLVIRKSIPADSRQRIRHHRPHRLQSVGRPRESYDNTVSGSPISAVSPEHSQNLMFDRRVYRGSNYARPVQTQADTEERQRSEASRIREAARKQLEQAQPAAPKRHRVRPIAGVQTDRMSLLTPLPGPANSSLEDADEAAAVYLVSHMEQLASELQSATIEETRLKQQLEYDQMKIQQLERSLEEARLAAVYSAEQRSSGPVVPPQPAAVEAMRSRVELEKEESKDSVGEAQPAEESAAQQEDAPDIAPAAALLPHEMAAKNFTNELISGSLRALVAKPEGSRVASDVSALAAEFMDDLIEAAIHKILVPEPEPEPQSVGAVPQQLAPSTETEEAEAAGEAEGTEEEDGTEEETEDDDAFDMDDMNDEEDLKRLAQMQNMRSGNNGQPGSNRRMSLADMKSGGEHLLQGVEKFQETLSPVEKQEYRDFFDIVDADSNGTIDSTELKQAMTMMGMDAPDDRISAMIGEVTQEMVHEGVSKLEMDFNEFLALMAIFVGPRGDQQNAELETAFKVIDADGGGTIDMEELADAFRLYGEKVTDEELDGIIKLVDVDADGEIDLEEFKAVMLTAVPDDAPEKERFLRRKMRTTVRTLIMRQRFTSAVQSFDDRYNFLRFSDAEIIASSDQNIVRLQKDQTVFAALAAMRAENVPCAPVYADEALKDEPIGFLYMNDVIRLLLATMQQMFKPAKDPVAVQLRLDRISGDASTFSKSPISSLVRNDWKPIRPGYMVHNLGGVLAQGVRQVPYCNDEGDLVYLIFQENFLAAFNDDPRVRLGSLAHVTAMELKCIKPVTKVPSTMPLAEAFKAADADAASGHAAVVVDDTTGKVLWSVGPETLNAYGLHTPEALGIALSKPVQDLYRDLLEQGAAKQVDVQAVVTCTPSTSLQDMVKRVVESGRCRLWVVDDDERPIGVVLLTEMIACIMSSEERKA